MVKSLNEPPRHTAVGSSVACGTVAVGILPINYSRAGATFVNISDTRIDLHLGPATEGVVGSGIPLSVTGGSYELPMNPQTGKVYPGTVSAICSADAKVLSVSEW